MYFTQEDYRKIEAYLKSKAVRDTSFDSATTPLQGNETIVLVQGGKNVNTTVSDIVSQFFALGVSDFINVTDKYGISYNTLDEAIRVIPWRSRKVGQVITFLNEQGEWHLYQYQGESILTWNNTTLWVDLLESRIVNSILPDQEDLTMTEPDADGNSYMHFKDKDYSIDDFSGLGRVYLRKNLQTLTDPNTGETRLINYLTQTMVGKENVIYHIQYDYNLNGQTIIIPEGCVLLFEGGSISNGTIIGNFIRNTYLRPEWFGAKGDGITNDSEAFQMVSNFCNSCNCKTIRLSESTYLIDNIMIYSYMSIIGEDKYKSVLKSYSNPLNLPILISDDTQGHNISLRNLAVESSGERTEYTVKILNKIGTIVDNCYFVRNTIVGEPNDYHGIFIGRKEGTETVYITKFTNNRVNQCCVTIEGTDGYIDHNELWGIGCKSALHLIKSGNHMISANQIVGGSVNGAMYLTEWATSLKIFGNYFDGGSTTVANVPYGLNVDTELIYSTITNNNFWLLDGAGIRAKTSIGSVINGNVFENNDRADNGTSDIILENTQASLISNNSFIRVKKTRVNKAPILNITGYTGTDYEPIIINGNVVRGYRNYSTATYTPKDSTIKSINNNSSLFEYITNASPYKIFDQYGELNYNSANTIKQSPLDAKVFTYVEKDRKIRLDNLTYIDSTSLTDSKFDFNAIYNKDFNLYINGYNSVLNPPIWITGGMWLENRYLVNGYGRQVIYSSNGNVLYSRILSNSVWSKWANADSTLTSKVVIV